MADKIPPLAPPEAKRAPTRKMTVVAQDPGVRRGRSILMATIDVPAEELVAGPIGYRVQIVDYDGAEQRFEGEHELPAAYADEPKSWREGDPKLLGDLRFHAQNTYALVMKTLARFERALGRRIPWSFDTHQIKVAPHGMADANAFYNPAMEGLVFGYFEGASGERVDTCLSHDIVVHETTHALLDALRPRFMSPSSPDQAAFHEGFADVVALLSVFSQPEVVEYLLLGGTAAGAKERFIARGALGFEKLCESALFGLAEQMGSELDGVRGKPLRTSARIVPSKKLKSQPEYLEPHRRGELFVAPVMRGFIRVWSDRVLTSGAPDAKSYPVARVAEEGADVADALVTMWIRALDYMPPVHLTFGDALTAALTADFELRPDDTRFQLREHMKRSFAEFGFVPNPRHPDGRWDDPPEDLRYDRVRAESLKSEVDEVFRFLWENRDDLALSREAFTKVIDVRPAVRVGVDGFVLRETVAQYYQIARYTREELIRAKVEAPPEYLDHLAALEKRAAEANELAGGGADDDPGEITTTLEGGGVLVFDEYGHLKHWIHNDVLGARQGDRLAYLWKEGQLRPTTPRPRAAASRLSELHRMRALDARAPSRKDRW